MGRTLPRPPSNGLSPSCHVVDGTEGARWAGTKDLASHQFAAAEHGLAITLGVTARAGLSLCTGHVHEAAAKHGIQRGHWPGVSEGVNFSRGEDTAAEVLLQEQPAANLTQRVGRLAVVTEANS